MCDDDYIYKNVLRSGCIGLSTDMLSSIEVSAQLSLSQDESSLQAGKVIELQSGKVFKRFIPFVS